jgi:hypothetical protein
MTTTRPTRSAKKWPDSRPVDWSPAWFPAPQWGTARSERQSYGRAAGILSAQKLGRPLLPWQQHVADVALEIDPGTGRLAYRQVVVTVPRQSGKTTGLLFTVAVLRCLMFGRRQRIVYTAQDRNSAREKFSEEFVPILREAPGLKEGRDFRVREANGSEAITFLASGSTIKISATLTNSGHGRTLDMPSIDEAFEHGGTDVEQGFRVPMITRPEPQLWVLSTAGDERAAYLERKRTSGRASVESPGSVPGLAYFEWSAEPFGGQAAPLDDRALWWQVMPALGHTITEDAIAAEIADMAPADARRAYLNVTQHRSTEEPGPIDVDQWGSLVDRDAQHNGRLVYGVDVTPDRSSAAVGVAGARVGGGFLVEVIESRPGTRWVPEFLAEVYGRNGGEGVAIDPGSAAGSLIPDLEALGVPVITMSARQHAQACGALVDRVPTGEVFHLGQPDLDDAVAGAKKRQLGDAWLWDRRRPDAEIHPLVAVTLAFGALLALPEEDTTDSSVSVYAERGFVEW